MGVRAAVRSGVRKLAGGRPTSGPDWVAAEAPLEIRIGGRPALVLMRTPGDDRELVLGFLFTEGLIAAASDIASIRTIPGLQGAFRDNVVRVELRGGKARGAVDRLFSGSASCGVCGKRTIASLEVGGTVATSTRKLRWSVLECLPGRLRAAQKVFAKTGGVHAAGLFTARGRLVALREDVGRHNALDKLVGWALVRRKLPLDDHVLLVSGRVSYEIVQKAVAAGIPLIAAVGAPSSLAIELCERFGITLVGFLRPGALNVYAHGRRVVG